MAAYEKCRTAIQYTAAPALAVAVAEAGDNPAHNAAPYLTISYIYALLHTTK